MQLHFRIRLLLGKSENCSQSHLQTKKGWRISRRQNHNRTFFSFLFCPAPQSLSFLCGSALSRSIIPTKISTRRPWNIKAEAEQRLKASLTRGCCISFIFHDDRRDRGEEEALQSLGAVSVVANLVGGLKPAGWRAHPELKEGQKLSALLLLPCPHRSVTY